MLVEMIGKSDGRNGGGSELERGDFCEYMYSESEGGRELRQMADSPPLPPPGGLTYGRAEGQQGRAACAASRPPPAGWLRDPTPRNFHFVTLSTLKFIAI